MNLINKEINGYKLLRLIGSGGMGEVYYAFHNGLKREAAVKVLYQEDMTDRFKNEAYIQASVQHPNIAGLYEFGEIAGKPCIVMEFINGVTLEKYVEQRSLLDSDAVTKIFYQVCKAISYLHEQGIQHRDIKPSNIKITPEGKIKLLDFGIAKNQYTPKLTKEGYIVGTTDYMSPEQFRGTNSIQSDIWAMGILLYFLTTRHLPFMNSSILEQRRNVESAYYIKPATLNPGVTGKHQRLIAQMLSARASKRPFIGDVIRILLQQTGEISMPKIPMVADSFLRKNRLYLSIIGGVFLLGIILFATESRHQKSEISVLKNANVIGKAEKSGVLELPKNQVKTVEIVVQNSNRTKLILPNQKIMYQHPFVVEIPEGESLQITLQEGKYSKEITIDADFKGDRFMCTMDY